MDLGFLIVIIGLIGLGIAVTVLQQRHAKTTQEQVSQNVNQMLESLRTEIQRVSDRDRVEMQQQLNRVHDQVYKGMNDSQSAIRQQFEQTSKIIQDVTQRLTTLDSTNKQVLDFSSQLQNLQNILKSPKQRGVVGEFFLAQLLGNVLSKESYALQHHLGIDEGTGKELIADAVIFVREQIIPIDAKFSLENYNRIMEEFDPERREKLEKEFKNDIKLRIDETSKYIQPRFNTMNFAFMFIPAEGVYYNLMNAEVGSGVNSRSLTEYAFSKGVMIVSPTSFYAYLQTVLLGLKQLQIEKDAHEIIKRVAELGNHFRKYSDYHAKIGKNLTTVVGQFNESSNELRKVSKDVIRITAGDASQIIDIEEVAKPLLEA